MGRLKAVFAVAFLNLCEPSYAQGTPTISIQVLDIQSTGIREISLSSEDGGDAYAKVEPPAGYDPTKDRVSKLMLKGSDFSRSIENFSLEVSFVSGTVLVVPLRLMRPTANAEKEIRLAGRRVEPTRYSAALAEAIERLSTTLAYESFSVCKSYFPHTRDHPSFQISAAICWLKANRYMVAATKPPYRKMFDADEELVGEMERIIGRIRKEPIWRQALASSLYPDVKLSELEGDLRLLELERWRLYSTREILALDAHYGKGTACAVFREFRAEYLALDQRGRTAIETDIGIPASETGRLMLGDNEFAAASTCLPPSDGS